MSRFNFPTKASELREDLAIESTGLRFRASIGAYLRALKLREFTGGDRVRLLINPDETQFEIRRVRGRDSTDKGLLVSTAFTGASPQINNSRMKRAIVNAFPGIRDFARWSLCEVGEGSLYLRFAPAEMVIQRVRTVVANLDELAEQAGFRPTRARGERQFFGERDTVLFNDGALTAMRCGRERSSIRVLVPYITADRIKHWFEAVGSS